MPDVSEKSWQALLHEATRALRQAGLHEARRNAEWMLTDVLGCSRAQLYAYPERGATPAQAEALATLVRRRARHEPLQYVLGYADFHGMRLRLTPAVLIPRPETEQVVEAALGLLRAVPQPSVLDVGTGSGCIALALKRARPAAAVYACDVSEAALEVARANVGAHGLSDRVRLIQSDVFDRLEQEYDLIVSNPPYVPERSFKALPQEYRHEPEGGLVAGSEGLDVISRIIRDAPRFLSPQGLLVVEAGEARQSLESRYPQLPFLWLEMTRGGDDVFVLRKEELP